MPTIPTRWFCLLSLTTANIHTCHLWMLFCVLFSLPLTIFSTQKLYVEKKKEKKELTWMSENLSVWCHAIFFFFFRPKCFVTVKTVCEEHSCDWTIFLKSGPQSTDWLEKITHLKTREDARGRHTKRERGWKGEQIWAVTCRFQAKKKKREKKLRAKQTTSVESQQFLIYSREFVREGRTLEL